MRLRIVGALLAASATATIAQATQTSCNDTPAPTKLTDIFWQLRDLEGPAPNSQKNVFIGNQNQTYCCLKAVGAALAIENGTLIMNEQFPFIKTTPEDFIQRAVHSNQFPCDATYNGNASGAPVVEVPYPWWTENCPGWQLNDRSNLESWLQPLSGFLIPAVPLIFSIPRRRKLEIYRQFFTADLSGVKGYLAAPLGALGAGLIVILDTLIWLSTCFAFAAPMILSGLYEALLDKRVLDFLKEKMTVSNEIQIDETCTNHFLEQTSYLRHESTLSNGCSHWQSRHCVRKRGRRVYRNTEANNFEQGY